MKKLLLTVMSVVAMLSTSALAFEQPQSDQDITQAIVQECLAIHHQRRPCSCPEDHARDGSLCGRRSAYNRPGGAEPKCYVSDVSAGEIADYRAWRKTFTSACEAGAVCKKRDQVSNSIGGTSKVISIFAPTPRIRSTNILPSRRCREG